MMRSALVGIAAVVAAAACGKGGGDDQRPQPTPAEHTVAVTVFDALLPDEIVLPPAPPIAPPPAGLPALPSGTSITPDKVALGRVLYFDPRLSASGTASCATCHDPKRGWADSSARSLTVAGKPNLRHTPSLFNLAHVAELYWDGRVKSLELLILSNWKGQLGADPNQVAALVADIPEYAAHFDRAFGGPPTGDTMAAALAAFVRTIRIGDDQAWSRYEAGDLDAVEPDAIAGFALFTGKAQCSICHTPPLYTDGQFHDLGIGFASAGVDPGRANATGDRADTGKFRTPTLRGATLSPPYFHDGSVRTLAAAIDYHLDGGPPGQPPKLVPIALTDVEKAQLLHFIDLLSPVPEPFELPAIPADR